jgi:hypothetical protein
MAGENSISLAETLEDMGLFVAWMIFGVLVGWFIAFIAHGTWMQSPYFDYYGIAGAAIAVLWAGFRRQKHLEHLPHVRRHLERLSTKRK